ncbi:MAG TPA: PD-(D/E)XK nuclease family protein [Vicinamibacterales bacterium]
MPDLHAFRESIAALASEFRAPLVVVPTRSAARQLAAAGLPAGAGVTRDELYDRFHARLSSPPRRLSGLERDVIAGASARAAALATQSALRLRPGLIAEMLRFYDQLRRQSQSIGRFEELIEDALGSDELDRGALRLRKQTKFLAEAFREYDRRVRASGACDEHLLRERLIAEAVTDPVCHLIVTVPDWIADADGLFVADFDLLSRIPLLQTIDVIATERVLASGFHERIHSWWPGIEELNRPSAASRPVLISPPDSAPDEPWWTVRDREEELVAVARRIHAERHAGQAAPSSRPAIIFKRPLPYLYLAREVFPSAGIAYQTFDGFPLAAEPTVAALDLILDAVSAAFTRDTLVALLRCPHLRFTAGGEEPSRASIAALDKALSDARYLGDPARLEALATDWERSSSPGKQAALTALRAAIELTQELAGLAQPAAASEHVRNLSTFWERHLRGLDDDSGVMARESHARTAVADTLKRLCEASVAYDDPEWTVEELTLGVKRWIEEQTCDGERGDGELLLLDDKAARYRELDDATIVGLVESDWPERPKRNIFYPQRLLKSLGWPSEKDRRGASDAHLLDLILSPSRQTVLSTFTLDDDALVSRSLQLDEVLRARMSIVQAPVPGASRVFIDEAITVDPPAIGDLEPAARAWATLRAGRLSGGEARFHGQIPAVPARVWSVSALETYLGCPFRFFAQHVLKLEEEPDDEEIMNPRRQGQFVHDVFQRFFAAWQSTGHAAVTADNLEDARAMFVSVVDEALAVLPDAEAGLERTRLLGSPAAAGLGEAVLRMEAERPTPVVERLLEHELRGEFAFETSSGARSIALRGKADRIDLLADGTFRLIDYKLGWPPKDRRKALQLPIYSLCASQSLRATRGGNWIVSEAAYLAFKGPRRVVPLFQNEEERDRALAEAQDRLATTLDEISAGHFPPTPDDVYRCETCGFASVCRKDYVGDV